MRSSVQRHAGLHQLLLAAHDAQMVVARAQHVGHLKQIGQDGRRLQGLQGVLHDVWVLRHDADEVLGVDLAEEGEIRALEFFLREPGSAGDGAESGVGVLKVWTCVALEGCHGVHVEVVVVDSKKILVAEGFLD